MSLCHHKTSSPVKTEVASRHIATSHSPSRRWIPQAPTRNEHQWQHTTSKSAIPPFRCSIPQAPTRDAHQWQRTQIKTSHSPSRRSIPQAPTRDAHQWQRTQIKTSHSPSRRSIPQAPMRDAHHWYDITSRPAIPNLDARFYKPLKTHISSSSRTNQNNQAQPFPI